MPHSTDDLRIRTIRQLDSPAELIRDCAASDCIAETVAKSRRALNRIITGADDRLIVVIGPCSIHDTRSAMEYAQRLAVERERLGDALEIVMRVYFEKPRTTVGWKGLINDPDLDGSFLIEKGLRVARTLLRDLNLLGMPAGCEFLDMITPQYIADLVSWGAIGARTTESQVHRELASGLSCPVGFKNGTDGNVCIAVDAVQAAAKPHHFMAVTKSGHAAIAATTGNPDCHIILRGGKSPNYSAEHVDSSCATMRRKGLPERLMIDASHANSNKQPENQIAVVDAIAEQIETGEQRIIGVMVESHLVAGRQDHPSDLPLIYGQSITDGCIGWPSTTQVLGRLADAVRSRRLLCNASALGTRSMVASAPRRSVALPRCL